MARVICTIDKKTHEVEYKTEGFVGENCMQVTEKIREGHDEADLEYTGDTMFDEVEIGE